MLNLLTLTPEPTGDEVSGNVSAVVHTADLNGKVRTLTEQVRLVKKLMKDGNNLKALEARVPPQRIFSSEGRLGVS